MEDQRTELPGVSASPRCKVLRAGVRLVSSDRLAPYDDGPEADELVTWFQSVTQSPPQAMQGISSTRLHSILDETVKVAAKTGTSFEQVSDNLKKIGEAFTNSASTHDSGGAMDLRIDAIIQGAITRNPEPYYIQVERKQRRRR